MTDENTMIEVMESRARRREDRRDFFMRMGGTAFLSGATALGGTTAAEAQTAAPTDPDILNFALNLEYLEAQFYSFASFGTGLNSNMLGGTGVRGDVSGSNATGARAVPFQDETVRQYAREIANDEIAHVAFLRRALGSAAVAQPSIDISINPNGAFSNAARAAGLITGPNSFFDPYASDNNFLLGAYIFEDVGVTAYKGASPLITSPVFLEAAAGLLAVEAYHAAIVRTTLYGRGVATPSLRAGADAISDARDSLDGMSDIDQGISPRGMASNIVPLDVDGLTFSRTTGQVLNIVYLNRAAVTQGGFFPAGVNGTIRASAAN